MKKQFLITALALCAAAVCMTCAFEDFASSAVVTDTNNSFSYLTVARQAFMGGSLFYYPDVSSRSHLEQGVSIAVRLGYVKRETAADGAVGFKDDASRPARYGYITVTNVTEEKIAFTYTSFNAAGSRSTVAYALKRGETADLNYDGNPDVRYDYPAYFRPQMESAVYLTFISSQDNLHTAMHAFMPDTHSTHTYPGGIFGVNPLGQFIASSHKTSNMMEMVDVNTELGTHTVYGLIPRDYVLAANTGYDFAPQFIKGKNQDGQEVDVLSDVVNEAFLYKRVMPSATNIHTTGVLSGALTGHLEALTKDDDLKYDFATYEFNNIATAALLYNKIKSGTGGINELNNLLKDKNLINDIRGRYPELTFSAADKTYINGIIANISSLTNDELTQVNRWFLALAFPHDCPPAPEAQTGPGDVLQLVSFSYSMDDPPSKTIQQGNETDASINMNRALGDDDHQYEPNYAAYQKSRTDMKTTFKQTFAGKFTLDLDKSLFKNYKVWPLLKLDASATLGINAYISCHWGKLELAAGAGVLIIAEASAGQIEAAVLPRSVFESPITLLKLTRTVTAGPVVITESIPITLDLKVSADQKTQLSFTTFAGFTGFYGANAAVGVEYKVKWKWGFIPVGLKTDPYTKATVYNQYATYAGPMFKSESGNFKLKITVEPIISTGVKSTLWGTVWGNFGVDLGFPVDFRIDFSAPKTFSVSISERLRVGFSAGLGIDIKIWHKDYKFAEYKLFDEKHKIWGKAW